MTEGAKERFQARAESCEKIAGLESASIELRMRFAYKASSFRIMAKLAALDEVKLNEDDASALKKIHGLAEIARHKPDGVRSRLASALQWRLAWPGSLHRTRRTSILANLRAAA